MMKKIVVLAAFIVLGTTVFAQTNEENNKAITALKTELKSESNKEKVKTLSAELKVREALANAYAKNDKAMIAKKKDELNGIMNGNKKKANDYNSSRSLGTGRTK